MSVPFKIHRNVHANWDFGQGYWNKFVLFYGKRSGGLTTIDDGNSSTTHQSLRLLIKMKWERCNPLSMLLTHGV